MNTRTKALFAVILGNSIFGFSFLFSKIALDITIPSVMLAVRFTVAFLVLNLIVLFRRKRVSFSLKGKPLKYVLLLAIFQPILYFVAESFGITYTSSAFAGTIIAVIPLMGIVFDVLLMRQKVTVKQVICSIGTVVGVLITTIGAKGMKSSVIGVLLLLVAVVAGALFYVFSKKAGEYYSPLERTYVMFGLGSVTYLTYAFVECQGKYGQLIMPALTSAIFWVCILYLAVVSSVMAFLLLNYGSSHVTVSEASIFANFTTVISIVAGVLFVHEKFTAAQVVGALVIIGSVYVVNVSKK